MKLTLTLGERVGAYIILIEVVQGPRHFLSLIKDAKQQMQFSAEDIKAYGVVPRAGGGIDWNRDATDQTKDLTISEGVHTYLKDRLTELDKHDKITLDLLDIANKILGEPTKNG